MELYDVDVILTEGPTIKAYCEVKIGESPEVLAILILLLSGMDVIR